MNASGSVSDGSDQDVVGLSSGAQLSLPATAESVRRAREAACGFAAEHGASSARLEAIRLAVSEAATNSVLHAYSDGHGEFHLTVEVAGGELWVLIADDGCGFQAPAQSPGLGLGLLLIADSTDDFTIAGRSHGGTEVRMRFALTTDPVATDPQTTDPVATDPQTTDPVATDPQTTDPARA